MIQKRKEWKERAKKTLKKHYWLFVVLCLAASFLGSEFSSSLEISKTRKLPVIYDESGIGMRVNSTSDLTGVFIDFLMDVAEGKEQELREEAKKTEEKIVEESRKNENTAFGRSRGVFSNIVNKMSSGVYLASLTMAIRSVVDSDNITVMILIVLSVLLLFFIQAFVVGIYRVIMRRMFLEGRIYEKVPLQRVWYLFKVRRWFRSGFTIFLTGVLETFWMLTIVGGIIKHYAYYLVPYIVAENPEIGTREAITLSRRLMKGYKWELFLFELSFLGWWVLGVLTLGLSNIFFTNAYRTLADGEFFAEVRLRGKQKQVEGAERLNDTYLFEKPDRVVLEDAYADVRKKRENTEDTLQNLSKVQRFFIEVFGLSLVRRKVQDQLEKEQLEHFIFEQDEEEYNGEMYPARLSPKTELGKRKILGNLNFLRHYSVWSITFMFFIMAFTGWLWEVVLGLVSQGVWANRGVLHGPWLPIYGTGSVLILLVLQKFRSKPAIEFLAAVTLCGTIEYFTSYFLELMYDGKLWWDYTGYFLNLHGRICAEGLLTFGIGGMIIVYVLAPFLDGLIRKIPMKVTMVICLFFISVFTVDCIYSMKNPNEGAGITNDFSQETVLSGDDIQKNTIFCHFSIYKWV